MQGPRVIEALCYFGTPRREARDKNDFGGRISIAGILTRQRNGFLAGYTHSLNPYLGCAFGARGSCPFCYVRALPVALAGGGLSWGDWVMAKANAPELLRRELLRLSARGERPRIFFSSSTDPYQGAEARLRITRRLLEVFAEMPDTFEAVLLQTRSPLVERDVDLLLRLRDKGVGFTDAGNG